MTINTNSTRNEYTATAAQTVFSYTFKIFASTDLNVYQTPAGQACSDSDLITAYTVTGVGLEDGGTIILNSGATVGDLITIVSDIPESRTTDYQTNGDFLPDTVNDDFDRVVSLTKQVEDKSNRSLQFDECLQGATSLSLPPPAGTEFLRWKSDLTGMENIDLATFGDPTNANVVTYTPGGVGAVNTTVEVKLREQPISVKDFGAVGDGATDDSVAVQAAFTAAALLGNKVHFPNGDFAFSGISIPVASAQTVSFGGVGSSHAVISTIRSKLINNDTTAMFTVSGAGTSLGLNINDVIFTQEDATSGHILEFTQSMLGVILDNVSCQLTNPASSFIEADTVVSLAMISINRMTEGRMAAAASVPFMNFKNVVGGNNFGFDFNQLFLFSNDTATAPIIRIEDASGGATSGPSNFKNIILEVCTNGGGIHLYSVRNPLFQTVRADDGTANAAPVILVDTSSVGGSQAPFGATFIDCIIPNQGDASFPDIKVVPGAAGTQTTLIGSQIGFLDTGTKPSVTISSLVSTFVNAGSIDLFSGVLSHPNDIVVPETQHGKSSTILTTAFEDITFATAFTSAPDVVVSHDGATTRSGPLTVTSVTTTGFRVYNWATQSATAIWLATN